MEKSEKIAILKGQLTHFVNVAVLSEDDYKLLQNTVKALGDYSKLLALNEESLKMSKVNTKWTDEEDKRLTDEFNNGWKIAKISKKHLRNSSGIIARLTRLGLITDNDENGKKRWTDEEDQKLLKEANAGKSLEKMAELHGRSLSGISARLVKLGFDIDE